MNEGLDIFYPKSLLKKLAGQGIDVTNFRPAVTPGGLAAQKARAAVSYHAKAGFQKKTMLFHRIRRALSKANQKYLNNLKTNLSGTQKDHIQNLARKLSFYHGLLIQIFQKKNMSGPFSKICVSKL